MLRKLGGVAAVVVCAACSGIIVDPDPVANGEGSDVGAGGTSSAGVGGTGAGMAVPPPDPGEVVLRRLNRAEYDNTVAELLGTRSTPADAFPEDDVSHGFDTIGATLSLSPLHLELYEQAADQLVLELMSRPVDSPERQRVIDCDLEVATCRSQVVERFARRAFRRPVSTTELSPYLGLIDLALGQGDAAETGVGLAIKAVLLSPHFLFRVERDPAGELGPHLLSDHELATRLSYSIWSSMPDDDLFAAADAGRLQQDAAIRAEIARMLDDPRSEALVRNFAGQWWFTRTIDNFVPDYATYPDFDNELRVSMRRETERFFSEFLRTDRELVDMLTGEFSFVDGALATHYGLPPPQADFESVSLAGSERIGLLTQGSFLLVTSLPTRSAPVKRGKWVLEQILCSAPPPPPPGVDTDLAEGTEGLSLRERLEKHREAPACASCHQVMDPIGLGLERFNAIGAYRAEDASGPIDATGELPEAGAFDGARELSGLIAADPRFERCVARQFLTYALGRRISEIADAPVIDAIAEQARANGGTLRATIESALVSDVFIKRRSAATEVAP